MGSPKQDESWYLKVLEDHKRPLLRYTKKIAPSHQDAQDIVQNTFLKLWKQDLDAIKAYVRQWLFTVARNEAFDCHRKKSKLAQLNNDELLNSVPSNLEELFEVSEIFKMVAALPKNQQELVILKFQEGFSYKEISQITGHSVSHVGLLIHQAVTTLRLAMEGMEDK